MVRCTMRASSATLAAWEYVVAETIKVRSERFYSAHHTLLRIARDSLDKAKNREPGWADEEFVAVTLSALAIEAVCNAIGGKAVENWEDFETSSPTAKLRTICFNLGVEYDREKEPWSTLHWLSKFRNKIAHPKVEPIDETKIIPAHEYDDHHRSPPKSKLEKQVTLASVERAVRAVENTIDVLCDKLPDEDRLLLVIDSWNITASLHERG